MSGLVLAHEPVVAGRPVAAGLFLLALEAGIAGRAGAGVALLLVATSSAIVAGLGGAVVDVDFAETASESGRTVAEGRVGLGQTQSAVPAESFLADQRLAFVAGLGSRAGRHGRAGAFETGHFAL